MKKVYIIIIVLLFLAVCVMSISLYNSHCQTAEYGNEIQTLKEENSRLEHKLCDFPMTAAEEQQYKKNKELISTILVYRFGDTADAVSKFIHDYCRLGIIPNGEIVSVEYRTWTSTTDDGMYSYEDKGLYIVTLDGSEYCVIINGYSVDTFIRGPSLDGEVLYMEIM